MKLNWFSNLGERFDRLFIPQSVKGNDLDHWKAKLLVFLLLFTILLTFVLEVSTFFVESPDQPPLVVAIFLGIAILLIFRKTANFIFIGNCLAVVVFFVLLGSVMETGGLFSDNLLWMIISPLLALLFADRISGLIWLAVIVLFSGYLFYFGNNSPDFFISQIENYGAQYYFISYAGLFVFVVFIVLAFATGQSMIIKALDEKQTQLSAQKKELEFQSESLQKAHIQLKSINEELEQFAYAASHDLKEPLRMIKMYTQFIEKRIQDQLDEPSKEYIYFVVDGVVRMERLLTDLLEYSRLGRQNRQAMDTDLNDVLLAVINNLTATMQETNTSIMCNDLPVLQSTSTEMIQLFQNLIANSIKFRRKDVSPIIEIEHQIENEKHHFHVKDNGIGIPEEACDRVFNIFERLHSKTEFEGTGIGLATCKKIVDNLGGRIWVEPRKENVGTTFQIIIPTDFSNKSK